MDEERNLNPTDAQEQFELADAYYYSRGLAQDFTKALYEKSTQNMLAYGYNIAAKSHNHCPPYFAIL